MKYTTILLLFIFCASLLGCHVVSHTEPSPVTFKDKNLEQLIRETIDQNEGDLTQIDLEQINQLDASHRYITNLEGVQSLVKLEELKLAGNKINDLSPLKELEKLTTVDLADNPLALEAQSSDANVIEELIDRGVQVNYDQKEIEQEFSKGVFYQVANGANKVYLFGSIQVGTSDLHPLHPMIEEAYEEASQVAFEVNVNRSDELEIMQTMLDLGVYSDGTSLKDHISTNLYEELLLFLQPYEIGSEDISRFKPWVVANMIQSQLLEERGFEDQQSIANHFLLKAEEDGKKVLSLEQFSDHIMLSNKLEPTEQESLLKQTLQEIQVADRAFEQLISYWKNGDIEALEELREADQYKDLDISAYMAVLTEDRDVHMTEKIIEILESEEEQTTFIVVGSIHLVGNNSIVDLLGKEGYQVLPGLVQGTIE